LIKKLAQKRHGQNEVFARKIDIARLFLLYRSRAD